MDGRTLKRKRRLMQELQEGKRGEPLKAHEVLGHATELMQLLGENLSSLRALKPKLPARPPLTNEFLDAVRQTQSSYNYDPRAWALLGINIERVMQGASGEEASEGTPARRRGRRRKAA